MKRISLTLLFLSIMALFCFTSLPMRSMAQLETFMSVDPSVLTGLEIGVSFTVNITITNVTDLYGWQFTLYYKSSVLNATNVTEGPFLKQGGANTFFYAAEFNQTYNATHGRIVLTASRIAPTLTGAEGTGTIAAVTFTTLAYGNSLLDLTNTKLSDSTQPFGKEISHEVHDGRVHVGLVDISIINIAAPQSIPKGSAVVVNVTVENQGVTTETFDVSLYYDSNPVETKTVSNLAPAANQILSFILDATAIPIGQYRLTANATLVSGEVDLEDNSYDAGLIYIGRRDITVTNTHPSKTVTNDTLVYINVTVANNGEAPANFSVTAYCDTNPIETKMNINLMPGASATLTFVLDTIPLQKGIYTISSTAGPVAGEISVTDNTYVDGTITETIQGDIDGNFEVNIVDISIAAVAFNTREGDRKWKPNADINNDGIINILDISAAAKNFGKKI